MKIKTSSGAILFFVFFVGMFSLSGCDIDKFLGRDKEVPAPTPAPEPEPEPDPVPTCGAITGKVRIINETEWEQAGCSIHVWAGPPISYECSFYFRDSWAGEHQWTYITGQEYTREGTYKIGSESVYSNNLAPGTYVVSFTSDHAENYLVDKDTLQEKEITNVRVYAGEVTAIGTVILRWGEK